MYYKYKPYYKFVLPDIPLFDAEKALWQQLHTGEITLPNALKVLQGFRQESKSEVGAISIEKTLSALSETFMTLGTDAQKKLVEDTKDTELKQTNFVTCMTKINKSIEEDKSVSQLILGTENQSVVILDPSGMKVVQEIKLDSVPMQLVAEGLFDVEYRLSVLCRDGKVYEIKNGVVRGNEIVEFGLGGGFADQGFGHREAGPSAGSGLYGQHDPRVLRKEQEIVLAVHAGFDRRHRAFTTPVLSTATCPAGRLVERRNPTVQRQKLDIHHQSRRM
jgi:hypothetical protein